MDDPCPENALPSTNKMRLHSIKVRVRGYDMISTFMIVMLIFTLIIFLLLPRASPPKLPHKVTDGAPSEMQAL